MRYNVEGADTSSGADRVITVEAEDERTAEELARREGLLVSAIFESQTLSPAEKLDLMVGEAIAKPDAAVAQPVPPVPPALIAYRTPTVESPYIPNYLGLKVASTILMIFAFLGYAIGGLLLVIGIVTIIGSAFYRGAAGAALLSLMSSASPLIAAGILHAMSAACTALRDIARNSFR